MDKINISLRMLAQTYQLNYVDEPIPSFPTIYFANSTCLPVHLSTCPPMYLSTCPPVYLSTLHETSETASPPLCKLFFIVWGILNLTQTLELRSRKPG